MSTFCSNLANLLANANVKLAEHGNVLSIASTTCCRFWNRSVFCFVCAEYSIVEHYYEMRDNKNCFNFEMHSEELEHLILLWNTRQFNSVILDISQHFMHI